MMKKTIIYLSIALLCVLYSCNTAMKEYSAAKDLNTEDAFMEFIEEHPDHLLADSARINIERLKYTESVNSISLVDAAYLFMKAYPESEYIDSLNRLLTIENNCQGIAVKAEISEQDIFDFDDQSLYFKGHINYSGRLAVTMRYKEWEEEENLVLLKISVFNHTHKERQLKINGENSIIIKKQDGSSKIPLAVRFKNPPPQEPMFRNVELAPFYGQITSGAIVYTIKEDDFVDFVCMCKDIGKGDILILNKSYLSLIE